MFPLIQGGKTSVHRNSEDDYQAVKIPQHYQKQIQYIYTSTNN